MAETVLLPYNVDTFNTIPDLRSSEQTYIEREGHKYIKSGFAELFAKHEATPKFHLVLLHRHGRLQPEQAMVDTNGTSVPWTVSHLFEDGRDCPKWNGSIFPSSWLVQDGRLMPYEFQFAPTKSSTMNQLHLGDSDVAFVNDFVDFTEHHGLTSVFGLGLLGDSQTKTLEITEGTANINFPLEDDRVLSDGTCVQAGWAFGVPGCNGLGTTTSWCVKGCLTNTHISVHVS